MSKKNKKGNNNKYITKTRKVIRNNIKLNNENKELVREVVLDAVLEANHIIIDKRSKKPNGKLNPKIKMNSKDFEFINLLLEVYRGFIEEYDLNDIIRNKQDWLEKDFEEGGITLSFFRDLLSLFFNFNFLDFFTFLISKYEDRTIKILKNIVKFGSIVPFEKLSIQEIFYKKFESVITDRNMQMDNIENINQSILSGIYTLMPALARLFAIGYIPSKLHSLFYWFIFTLLIITVYFICKLIKNIVIHYNVRNMMITLDLISGAIDDPKNINEDYIDFIREFIEEIKKSDKYLYKENDYKEAIKNTKIFVYYNDGKKLRLFIFTIIRLIFSNIGWGIILIILIFAADFYRVDIINYFLN